MLYSGLTTHILVAIVERGRYYHAGGFKATKKEGVESPYEIPLRGLKGDRIVVMWDNYAGSKVSVREFEVTQIPDNPSDIAFAGQWLDRETGLYYQINRYQIEGSDKFISPDPIGTFGGDNLYAYANNNPLEWSDPDGRAPWLVSGGLGALVGGAIGGGIYLYQWWRSGGAFDWKEFGIKAGAGAAAGFVAGATFGLVPLWVTGAASGFTGGSIESGLTTGNISDALYGGIQGAVIGGVSAAIGGVVLHRMQAPKNILLNSSLRGLLTVGAVGSVTGGTGGALGAGWNEWDRGGNLLDIVEATGKGLAKGAVVGGVAAVGIAGVGYGIDSAKGKTWDANRRAYWKHEGKHNQKGYSQANLECLKLGSAPQRINPITGKLESMELHHNILTQRSALPRSFLDTRRNLLRVWPDEHRAIDVFRR